MKRKWSNNGVYLISLDELEQTSPLQVCPLLQHVLPHVVCPLNNSTSVWEILYPFIEDIRSALRRRSCEDAMVKLWLNDKSLDELVQTPSLQVCPLLQHVLPHVVCPLNNSTSI